MTAGLEIRSSIQLSYGRFKYDCTDGAGGCNAIDGIRQDGSVNIRVIAAGNLAIWQVVLLLLDALGEPLLHH